MPGRPPISIFASTVDPEGLLEALLKAGTQVSITAGQGAGWREAEVTREGGPPVTLRHDPEYYAEASWSKQLPGMFGYFRQASTQVLALIRSFRFAVVVTAEGDESQDVASIICRHLDGAIFVPGALLDAEGRPLFSADGAVAEDAALPAPAPPHPSLLPRGALYDRAGRGSLAQPQIRAASCDELERLGFAGAYWLPQQPDTRLRPAEEIATRLMAFQAVFVWVARPEVPDVEVRRYAEQNQLLGELTGEDLATFEMPRRRANAERADTVGWRLENMWPLAWALGFESRPALEHGMIDSRMQAALEAFLPRPSRRRADWLEGAAVRSEEEIVRLEDLYYCAHHAVRSAQMGRATVPPTFHPIFDGGVVHERRHALTWLLAPGTSWDDTDLST